MRDRIIYGREYELPHYRRSDRYSSDDNTYGKLILSGFVILILCIGLCFSSFALAITANEYIAGNHFATGKFKINIAQKTPATLFDIAPGESCTVTYTIENESSTEIYFKVYTENIPDGGIADVLTVTVNEITTAGVPHRLYEGPLKSFVYSNPGITASAIMNANTTRDITVTYSMDEDAGNEYEGADFGQNLTVKAVQARNNPFKIFD